MLVVSCVLRILKYYLPDTGNLCSCRLGKDNPDQAKTIQCLSETSDLQCFQVRRVVKQVRWNNAYGIVVKVPDRGNKRNKIKIKAMTSEMLSLSFQQFRVGNQQTQ